MSDLISRAERFARVRHDGHPNYLHGTETLERKRQRIRKFAELRQIEDDLFERGFIKCKRTVGRQPVKVDMQTVLKT